MQASSTNSSAPNSSSSATSSTQPGNGMVPPMSSEAEILHEAKMLREHKDRLESRMRLLEVHNDQLELQLGKLRTLLNSDGSQMMTNGNNMASMASAVASITSNKTGTLNTKGTKYD